MADEMRTELTTEQRQQWDAAAASLMTKLGEFGRGLDTVEQTVLASLLQAKMQEGDEVKGYWQGAPTTPISEWWGPPPPAPLYSDWGTNLPGTLLPAPLSSDWGTNLPGPRPFP